MKANTSRLLERIKALGIGKERPFECISLYEQFRDTSKPACSYWTQERLQEFSLSHPQSDTDRRAGALKVLLLGCPFTSETEWGLGSHGTIDEDGTTTEPAKRTPRPSCADCEHFRIY